VTPKILARQGLPSSLSAGGGFSSESGHFPKTERTEVSAIHQNARQTAPAGRALSPLGPGHHHVDVSADALGTDEPPAPIGDGCLAAIPFGHLSRVRLGPVTTRFAPHDKPHTCRRASLASRGAFSSAPLALGQAGHPSVSARYSRPRTRPEKNWPAE
jgi:hypothetical protein